MRYSNVPAARENTTHYQKFKGADFSTDPSQVDDDRSPMPLNLIADEGGFPEKRPGWRTLKTFSGKINGIYSITVEQQTHLFVHHGTVISLYDPKSGSVTDIKTGAANHKSMSFVMNGALYVLTGSEYLVISKDGESWSCAKVSDKAYTPRTVISRNPKGGGTTFEAVNLLNTKRQNDFLADGSSTDYQLDAENIDSVVSVEVNGAAVTSGYTVDKAKGIVKFTTAPKKPEEAGGVAGADNVKIVYSKTVSGYADRINGCTICSLFGRGSFDRVFLSGNPEYKNLDWYCGFNDPTYIPDTSFSVVGSEETAIMGYLRVGAQQVVVKEDNQQDSTIFIRTTELNESGEVKFSLQQGVQSIGAVSKYCFASLRDDPLFLSRYGVNSIVTNNITLERTVKRRSGLVDPLLIKENGLENACGCVWGDWFVIAVNGRCYVADSKQQSYKSSIADNFMYEWYYWNNVPARVLFEYDNTLYFGTADGKFCRFNTDIDDMSRFNDDGAPIVAEWATKADDDGDFMRYKTMIRRGSGVQCKPYIASSIKILIKTEKDFGREIKSSALTIFDFNEIDFNNFSFNTFDGPQIIPFNTKVRKYKTMQIIVRNDGKNQGFGVFKITKRYKVMNYVK